VEISASTGKTPTPKAPVLKRHGNPYRTVLADTRNSTGLDWGVYGYGDLRARCPGVIVYKQIGPSPGDLARRMRRC